MEIMTHVIEILNDLGKKCRCEVQWLDQNQQS